MIKCQHCNEAEFETEMQLRGHQMKCRPKEDRKERVPFGVPAQRLKIEKEPGFVYRAFNDNWRLEPGRIKRAIKAGWEVVETDENNEPVGTNDDGTEIKVVHMRIPEEFYKEDQAAKQAELDKVDEQIYAGRFQQGKNDLRYKPSGGIKTETKLTG